VLRRALYEEATGEISSDSDIQSEQEAAPKKNSRGKLARSLIVRDYPSDTDRAHSVSPPNSVYNAAKTVERPNKYTSVDGSSMDPPPKDNRNEPYSFALHENVEPVGFWETGIVGQHPPHPNDAPNSYVGQTKSGVPVPREPLSMSTHTSMKQALMDQDNDVPVLDSSHTPLIQRRRTKARAASAFVSLRQLASTARRRMLAVILNAHVAFALQMGGRLVTVREAKLLFDKTNRDV
jgi:hypothetical protein